MFYDERREVRFWPTSPHPETVHITNLVTDYSDQAKSMSSLESTRQLLAQSQLFPPAQLKSLAEEYAAESDEPRGSRLLRWLVKKRRLTPFQARVLHEGDPGPFLFGDYVIENQWLEGAVPGSYGGRHLPSGHRVRIHFFRGERIEDARHWDEAKRTAESWCKLRTPFLIPCVDVVSLDEYRFLVFDHPDGKSLAEKLEPSGRLPWLSACQAAEQLALGLQILHQADLPHGQLSPETVWIQPSGLAQVMLAIPQPPRSQWQEVLDEKKGISKRPDPYRIPQSSSGPPSERDDLFAFGVTLLRLISKQTPEIHAAQPEERKREIETHLQSCQKYDLPAELCRLITDLLKSDLEPGKLDMSHVVETLSQILGSHSLADSYEEPSASFQKMEQMLVSQRESNSISFDYLADLDSSSADPDKKIPNTTDWQFTPSSEPSLGERQRVQSAAMNRSTLWLVSGLGCLSLVCIALFLFGDPLRPTSPNPSADSSAEAKPPESLGNSASTSSPLVPPATNTPPVPSGLVQNVVEDDGTLLWESPTTGPPLNVAGLPAAPDFLCSWRPASLMADEHAARFLKALGPNFEDLLSTWQNQFPLPLEQVERFLLSFHSDSNHRYAPFVVVELASPQSVDQLLQQLPPSQQLADPDSDILLYERQGLWYYFESLEQSSPTSPTSSETETVQRILVGPQSLITQSAAQAGVNLIRGTMAKLVQASDQDRDINLLLLPPALLSEECESLFQGPYRSWRRQLYLLFDEDTQGAALSLHFDQGNYFELQLQHTANQKPSERLQAWQQRIRSIRDQMIAQVAEQPTTPYWETLQARFDSMMIEWARETRCGLEEKRVVANTWLPPMAFHNFAAVAELSTLGSLAGSSTTPDSPPVSTPANLAELLAAKRDLKITSKPDLVNLLDALVEEIKTDFPELSFEFKIQTIGSDLREAGITQNQRLGTLDIQQRSLAEILTEVVFQANPDKNAQGPRDPRCKLVWLVGEDPNAPDTPIILITTRAAAQNKGWQIPEAFQPE